MPRTDRAVVFRRALAFVVDAFVVAAAVQPVASRLGRSREGRLLATAGLAGVGGFPYHVLLEGASGRTAGKAASGVVVLMAGGGPCTYRAAATRTVLRLADWLPAGYLLGLAAIAATERDQRLGDLAAGTVVVETDGAERPSRLRESARAPRWEPGADEAELDSVAGDG